MSTGVPGVRESVVHTKKIADGIVHVSKAIKDLEKGDLNEKAILVLLANATGMSQSAIKKVLAGLSELEEMYLKPKEERHES